MYFVSYRPASICFAGGVRRASVQLWLAMINTIEHVYDAGKLLTNAFNALKPGGLFIFGESHTEVDSCLAMNDLEHPICLGIGFYEQYFTNFDVLWKKRVSHKRKSGHDQRSGCHIHDNCFVYALLRKPSMV